MNRAKFLFSKAFLLAAAASAPVFANAQAAKTAPLVEVSLTNVKAAIAKAIQADVEKIPLMIKVPAETAKKVCNVTSEGLAPQANSGVPSCPADKTSAELNDAVKQEIAKTSSPK
jgi:hypothetical protein